MEASINRKERLLIDECRKGTTEGFEKLYKYFYQFAMSVCFRYVKNEGEAMDIVNDTFLHVFDKLDQFDADRSFKPWLRRILVNNSINYIKKYSKHALLENDDESDDISNNYSENDGLHNLSYNELLELIQELAPAYMAVFNMYVIDGYSHEEISKTLSISINTSKSNLSRARENLRKKLKKSPREIVRAVKL
ncbi:MAG: RNA polymerase sigma factor [Bacteroidota bacterium]